VTAKVSFKDQVSLPDPRTPPPTFLFLLIFNCQITDQIKPVEIPRPKPKSGTNQHRSQSKKSRAKVTVASSAAALVL
jgi:hypothetical protein